LGAKCLSRVEIRNNLAKKETIMLASFFKAQFKRPYFDDEHFDVWFKALGVIVWKLSPYLCNTLAVITIP